MHNIIYANTLAQADDAVRKHKVGVAVIDAAMVGDNVEKLTVHLRTTTPRLVAIVAGRRDDGEMLMDLINRGKVYRFLLKPVSPGRARLAIEASVKHHLEAPDAAFRSVGSAAEPKPAPKAVPPVSKVAPPKAAPAKAAAAPAAAPVAKPQSRTEPKIVKTPARPAVSKSVPVIKVEPRLEPVDSTSLVNDALGDAFGGDDKSFTETMTGIARTVGSTLTSVTNRKSARPADIAPPPARVETSDTPGAFFRNPKFIGLCAAAIVAVLGIGWWLFSGPDKVLPVPTEEPLGGTPRVTEADPVFDAPAAKELRPETTALLADARLATNAGQIFNPPGSNAIELYLAAASAAPNDATIAAELDAVIAQALSLAESSLLAKRPQDAAAALQRVTLADADNARLPFLNAQLVQMQLRDFLDSARLAIRDSRYEDAAVALKGARALKSDGAAEIALVAEELSAAQKAQRVDDVLAKATRRLDEGKLTAPSNDNARYYFELALSNDPGNTAARQGLNVVASKLVLQARAEIDAGNFTAAENLLADARRLDPGSNELNSATTVLTSAREQQAQERRAEEQRAAAEKAAAVRAAAERLAAEKAAAEKAAAEALAAEQADLAAANAQSESVEETPAESTPTQDEPDASVPADPPATNRTFNATPVAVSSLVRTKYVGPKYPRAAQRRGLSGWVDVIFTVDIDGTVTDISIRDSNPGVTFVNSAVSAVEDWEFEPVVENGVAVQKRAAVRMMFAVE
jgi:protein TonB